MTTNLTQYYQAQKKRIIETCSACGKCVLVCPIIEHTHLRDSSPQAIQRALLDYLAGGEMTDMVHTRIYACMACFRCSVDTCPLGLDPMLMIEIARWEAAQRQTQKNKTAEEEKVRSQKVLASIQVPATDLERLFRPPEKTTADVVFFPGCNVYNQPEKVLSALDIMQTIGEDWLYLPGVDNCCGDSAIFDSDIQKAGRLSESLINKLKAFQAKTVVLWCPTCKCRFDAYYEQIHDLPFMVLSFPQYVVQHFDKLTVQGTLFSTQVTLHEACKSAYLNNDLNGIRELINKLPGYELVEMPRHGKETACCGSGAVVHYKDSFNQMRRERLTEAMQTGACAMVDVCHYCHQTFNGVQPEIDVVNYISLLTESMGIARPDKLKHFLNLGDVNLIMEEAKPYLKTSPYSEDMIREAVKALLDESLEK